MMEREMQVIFEGDAVEANLVKGKLESAGIRAYLQGENVASLLPLQGMPTGFGAVKVAVQSADAAAARKLLSKRS